MHSIVTHIIVIQKSPQKTQESCIVDNTKKMQNVLDKLKLLIHSDSKFFLKNIQSTLLKYHTTANKVTCEGDNENM